MPSELRSPADLEPFTAADLPLPGRRDGKVRTSYAFGDGQRLFVTTDRLSAFDRVLAGVPYKGQVLNQLSAWWFEQTADIVANHVIDVPDPNVLIAREVKPLPVEVVVRGHITGVTDTSLWQRYVAGERTIDGHDLPDGLAKNDALPAAIVTPTTKGGPGVHDEPISGADVVARGLVSGDRWAEVTEVALALFARGQHLAAQAGLILADTKYELGLDADDRLVLIDEVHTPDSSRIWVSASYERRHAVGDEPESLDKEVVRRAFVDAGYRGAGEPPRLGPAVWTETSARYIDAFERLTGRDFNPGQYPVLPRIRRWIDAHPRENGAEG